MLKFSLCKKSKTSTARNAIRKHAHEIHKHKNIQSNYMHRMSRLV